MAKASGGTRFNSSYQYDAMKKLNVSNEPTLKRLMENESLASEYAKTMVVEKALHPNGAFFAYDKDRLVEDKMHEFVAGRIIAENGLYMTLDKEGHAKVQLPGRNAIQPPSGDGVLQGLTHEIYGFKSKPANNDQVTQKIIDGITHSFKPFKPDSSYNFQADAAVTIATKGSGITIRDVNTAVRAFVEGKKQGFYKASPKLYIHVSEEDRTVHYYRF